MSVVDIGTVEGDDVVHFSLNGLPDCLDAQHFEYLADVVRRGPLRVDVSFRQNLQFVFFFFFKLFPFDFLFPTLSRAVPSVSSSHSGIALNPPSGEMMILFLSSVVGLCMYTLAIELIP